MRRIRLQPPNTESVVKEEERVFDGARTEGGGEEVIPSSWGLWGRGGRSSTLHGRSGDSRGVSRGGEGLGSERKQTDTVVRGLQRRFGSREGGEVGCGSLRPLPLPPPSPFYWALAPVDGTQIRLGVGELGCRDTGFGWERTGSRSSTVGHPPQKIYGAPKPLRRPRTGKRKDQPSHAPTPPPYPPGRRKCNRRSGKGRERSESSDGNKGRITGWGG